MKKYFLTKKKLIYTSIKDVRNLFKIEKETRAMEDRVVRDINNLFEQKEEGNYYKPVTVSNFWCYNYVVYESNSDRNKLLSI